MKLIDEKGRLFGRLSVVDLLVVLAVVVMAAALYVKNDRLGMGGGGRISGEEQTITFQVRLRGAQRYLVDAIRTGEEVHDPNYSSGSRTVGEITGVEIIRDPGAAVEALDDGTAGPVEAEDTVNLLLTVKGSGLVSGKSRTINRVYDLGLNASRTFYTNRAQFIGTVSNIF